MFCFSPIRGSPPPKTNAKICTFPYNFPLFLSLTLFLFPLRTLLMFMPTPPCVFKEKKYIFKTLCPELLSFP